MSSPKELHYLHKQYPKTCVETDFWGQVKRTVNGQPVPEEQITMIVDAVRGALALGVDDTLLDLGCGNGALSDRFFAHCRGGVGVDFSEHMLSIAHKYFQCLPDRIYQQADIVDFAAESADAERFTKAVCYGVFAYLPAARAPLMLEQLNQRFRSLTHFFIGNVPDRQRLDAFYGTRERPPGVEYDSESPVGIWHSEDEFVAMAEASGWRCQISRMPAGYYAAHYRFDALLTR